MDQVPWPLTLKVAMRGEERVFSVGLLGTKDRRRLVRAGAPRANQRSNAISNFFISRFAGQRLIDTNCGLRRYPVRGTVALGLRGTGHEQHASQRRRTGDR